jgi:50S ribosomal subunit-associated GTPase HflX
MAGNGRNIKLTSVDDLFSSEESRRAEQQQQGEQVLNVPISEVHDFANNPFHVQKDAELMEMVEEFLPQQPQIINLLLPFTEAHLLNTIHEKGKVVNQEYKEEGILCSAFLPEPYASQMQKYIVTKESDDNK